MSSPLRVLVIDDEPALRRLIQAYLARLGHTVKTFPDGEQGLAALSGEPYDLAVVDLTLPGLSGEELLLALFDAAPALRILVCSGYPFDVRSLPDPLQARVDFLQKPFLSDMLQASVQRLAAVQ